MTTGGVFELITKHGKADRLLIKRLLFEERLHITRSLGIQNTKTTPPVDMKTTYDLDCVRKPHDLGIKNCEYSRCGNHYRNHHD